MEPQRVIIFDTTLRDGGQCRGTPLSPNEKLEIARHLADLKVDVIEAAFPARGAEEVEALGMIGREIRGPVLAALCRADTADIEQAARVLESADRPRLHCFVSPGTPGGSDPAAARDAILQKTHEAVTTAKRYVDDVEFSPHNASRTEPDLLRAMVEAAVSAGAGTINIADTLGYAVPDGFAALIRDLRATVSGLDRVTLSVHCHNDLGLAVANSLAALTAGARQVECTVNGIGERAGNAALEEIVMALKVRRDAFGLECGLDTRHLKTCSETVSRITGYPLPPNKAIVGRNALHYAAGALQNGFERADGIELIHEQDIDLK